MAVTTIKKLYQNKAAWWTVVLAIVIPLITWGAFQVNEGGDRPATERVAQATEPFFVEIELLGDGVMSEPLNLHQFPRGWCYWPDDVPEGTVIRYDDGTTGSIIDPVTGDAIYYGRKTGDAWFEGPLGETLIFRSAPPPPGTSCSEL